MDAAAAAVGVPDRLVVAPGLPAVVVARDLLLAGELGLAEGCRPVDARRPLASPAGADTTSVRGPGAVADRISAAGPGKPTRHRPTGSRWPT